MKKNVQKFGKFYDQLVDTSGPEMDSNRNSISVQSMNSSLSQTSLQSSNNSRAFDFDGLEESLVDNELNESIESLDDICDDRRHDTTSFHRIRDALIRDSGNRNEMDLDLIHNFLSLVVKTTASHSLTNKDCATRRLLAKHMVLAEIESRDTRVLTHGERLDAYCIVACGSLRHVITGCHTTTDDDASCVDCVDGECHVTCAPKVRYLTVGDEFGANLDDRVVFGEIYTAEDFVWVLCVPHVVFDEICGEKSFKTVFDEKNEKIVEIRNHVTNELLRSTRERLLEILFSSDDTLDDRRDDRDDTQFISDFLLTFRLFWSPKPRDTDVRELMSRVLENLESERAVEKNVKIVLFWISNHFKDFKEKEILFSFENSLKTKIHKKLFYFTLSSKSRERHVTLTRSDRAAPLPFSLIGGYECSTRLFVSDVTDHSIDLQRGDRLISINGVDCHVMEISRALQLCRTCTHLSLHVVFDPNLFHLLLEGQISRNSDRLLTTTDGHKTTALTTSHASFASLKQLSSLSSSQMSSSNHVNNNWKQKMKQIVQNVTTNNKLNHVNNNNGDTTTTPTTETPEIIKIYFESDFRYLPIHVTTSARECIQLALIEFQLNTNYSSRDFALYEYKLIDAKTTRETTDVTTVTSAVKRFSDNYNNLIENLSLNSRIYLKCISGSATINDTEITREISREVHVNSLLTLDSEAIARELTSRDFELFCQIESQQFIYDLTTGDDSCDDSRRELKAFEEKTNFEMFWTINQILVKENTCSKRVKIVKQLIRVALFCRHLKNFNSLFAITSGLSHQSVQRLKTLWERIPSKTLQKLKKLYKIMDPSKNFGEFRNQLRHCQPPIIPFFPLVKKDLSFIFLANQTFVESPDSAQLINWEKMRLLAQNVKHVQTMAQHDCPPTTPTTRRSLSFSDSKETNYKKIWEKQRMRKRVQHFLDESFLNIICDENVLFEKSLECESQVSSSVVRLSSQLSSTQSSSAATTVVMPSPTLSSHSSSPSLSSSTTNSSDLQSQTSRLRFGIRDDTGLRKLLALSDNCVSVVNDTQLFAQQYPTPVVTSVVTRLSSPVSYNLSSVCRQSQSLPQESSSVTSLRRLEQLQQMSRFREQFNQSSGALLPVQHLATHRRHFRPSLPSYDQTIQRMKKKFNSKEENIV